MKLIIAEKPSVGKTIASVVGAKSVPKKGGGFEDGFLVGNGYIVTWAYGHLFTLCDAKDYNSKYAKWSLDNLPIIPSSFRFKLIDDSGVKKQFKIIENLVLRSDVTEIINACDSDREANTIFWEIINAIGINKPVKRLWVSSHTPDDLKHGLANLRTKEQDAPLTEAGFNRIYTDWLYGINMTVASTLRFSKDKSVLKVGRVILPTVYLVYKRDMEIKNFKPQKFFELLGTFRYSEGSYQGIYVQNNQTRFDSPDDLSKAIRDISDGTGKIVSCQTKKVSQGPPRLFNLTDLQGWISSRYDGFTAEKVLKCAQSLYEKQFTTYPRTASRYLDDTLTDQAKRSLDTIKGSFNNVPLQFTVSKNVFDSSKVDSHPALMPTHIVPQDGQMTADEKIVYQEIVKRFVAQFAPAAVYDQTEAITDISGYQFKTKGKVLIEPGWKAIYNDYHDPDASDSDSDEQDLKVVLKQGMTVGVLKLDKIEKTTKPPAKYTIQTLLKAMENCGKDVEDEDQILKGFSIGTSATRAETLKKIEQMGYVELKNKSYSITSKGIALVEVFPIKEMLKPEFTGRIEKKLKDIELGRGNVNFLDEIKDSVTKGIEIMKGTSGIVGKDDVIIGKCPECGRNVVEYSKAFGCSGYKEGCKFALWKEDRFLGSMGKKMTASMAKKFLSRKPVLVKGLKSKTGKVFDAHIELIKNNNGYWGFSFVNSKEGFK